MIKFREGRVVKCRRPRPIATLTRLRPLQYNRFRSGEVADIFVLARGARRQRRRGYAAAFWRARVQHAGDEGRHGLLRESTRAAGDAGGKGGATLLLH